MRKLAFLSVTFALVAVSFYGCDEDNPTAPVSATGPAMSFDGARSSLSSTFDSGNEGWTLVGDAAHVWTGNWSYRLYPQHHATGGNPGGHVSADDLGKTMTFYWQAPPKYLGNRLGVYGGALQYDVKYSGSGGVVPSTDLILAGAGMTLVNLVVPPHPTTAWTTYSVPFAENAGWRHENPVVGPIATAEDIRAVLKDLTVLRIRGEYLGGLDTGYLDNVLIVPKGHVD